MIKLKRLGRIFNPLDVEGIPWMREYAQLPFPYLQANERLRVFFSTRPNREETDQYVSRTGYIDISLDDFSNILAISEKPVIDLGTPGCFDEFGAMASSFIEHEGKLYGYYTGWNRLTSVPYTMANGLVISNDNGNSFRKYSIGPIMGVTQNEPFLLSGPIVKKIEGCFHMWYLNGTKWTRNGNKFEPIYKIVHAESKDGIIWNRNGKPILNEVYDDECQVSFALFERENKWYSIFAFRNATDFRTSGKGSYSFGLACSDNLLTWERIDNDLVFETPPEQWDSDMQCYPQILDVGDRIYIFYCGNNFGREGFGVAEVMFR